MRSGRKRSKNSNSWVSEIESALAPGTFISYRESWEFVSDLETVKQKLDRKIESADSDILEAYEVFLSGCHEKAEELDDSSGSFGDFVQELFCSWVKARQKSGLDPEETVRLMRGWMENDNYGFAYQIEKQLATTLARHEYKIFVRQLQDDLEKAHQNTKDRQKPLNDYSYGIRKPAMALKDLFVAKKDVKSYIALLDHFAASPKDCEAITAIYQVKRKYAEALEWVIKGQGLEKERDWHNQSSWDLRSQQQMLLSKLGRSDEALEDAWDQFRQHPSVYSYEDFMQYVPKRERKEWHSKAMDAASRGDIGGYIEICTKCKEWKALAERIGSTPNGSLESQSHYILESAAKGLEKSHKAESAKIYRALGMRIVNQGKSKYYTYAWEHFRKAKSCFQKSGLETEWDEIIEYVKTNHSRKSSFIGGFEEIAANKRKKKPESFAERAKRQWKKQTKVK